ncbi:MAG: hypothetical protein ABI562_00380 [Chloroflexota bacterium]
MDPTSPAEELPALYRAVLDRVAQVATTGQRDLANSIRAEATRIYSRSWDERARRELEALLRRYTETVIDQPAPARASRRRTVRAA